MLYVFSALRAAASGVWFGAAGMLALGLVLAAVTAGWQRIHRRQWARHGLAEIEAYLDDQRRGG